MNDEERALQGSHTRVVLIAGLPPPYHGTSVYAKSVAGILQNERSLAVRWVDTSDRRWDLNNLGKLDGRNIIAALRALAALTLCCIRFRPHILWVPVSQGLLGYLRDGVFILLGNALGARVLIHLHGSSFRDFYDRGSPLLKWFVDQTMRRCSGAIVLGSGLQWIFSRWLPPEKVFVLPNFVMPARPLDKMRNGGPVAISFLANIYPSKGIFDLMEAVTRLLTLTVRRFRLVIAGQLSNDPQTGMASEDCLKLLRLHMERLKDVTEYRGDIISDEEKWALYEQTDIFVLPSWNEGQPLVILEAMAAGCPVVSTKGVGAIEETVLHGETGLLVDRGNVEELAITLKRLVEDDDTRERMSARARQRYEEHYTPELHMMRFKEIVNQIGPVKVG